MIVRVLLQKKKNKAVVGKENAGGAASVEGGPI